MHTAKQIVPFRQRRPIGFALFCDAFIVELTQLTNKFCARKVQKKFTFPNNSLFFTPPPQLPFFSFSPISLYSIILRIIRVRAFFHRKIRKNSAFLSLLPLLIGTCSYPLRTPSVLLAFDF